MAGVTSSVLSLRQCVQSFLLESSGDRYSRQQGLRVAPAWEQLTAAAYRPLREELQLKSSLRAVVACMQSKEELQLTQLAVRYS